jgi:hypothetical protein
LARIAFIALFIHSIVILEERSAPWDVTMHQHAPLEDSIYGIVLAHSNLDPGAL